MQRFMPRQGSVPRKAWLVLVVAGYLAINVLGYALLVEKVVTNIVLATSLILTTGVLYFLSAIGGTAGKPFVRYFTLRFRFLMAFLIIVVNLVAYFFLPANYLAFIIVLSAFLLAFLFVPALWV